jgi:hypothetical protein
MCTYVLLLHQKSIDIIMINNLLFYDNGVRLSVSHRRNRTSPLRASWKQEWQKWFGTGQSTNSTMNSAPSDTT